MAHTYEQRFFSALKDTFIGQPIKGKSGYVNLMDIKAQYFSEVEPYIQESIDAVIESDYREELFEKLYTFFDCYLNETGTVFFAKSQLHRNLYEKVYSDRDDVSLFWKTQKLYYVKSEANYDDLQTEVNGIKIVFDASEIKNAKGNEKKALQFHLVKADDKEIVFKVKYQESNSYDRIKEYLDIDKNNDILDTCFEKYGESLHGQIAFDKCELDKDVFIRKGDIRKCINIENIDDVTNTAKVSYTISDFDLTLQYLNKKGIVLYEDDIKKIFTIYKRQNEIDYFIHKDAEGFLKEQFDIYVYNWLFNDLDTDFDAATVKRMQNIKKIAHKVIEYIARFEDELKAIWEKPKFVRNCNYVITLDRLANNVPLIKKIIDSPGWSNQVEEWKSLKQEWLNDKGEVEKKEWKEFEFAQEENLQEKIIIDESLNKEYQYLPIDLKHFIELKYQVLNCFEDLDKSIDGVLIKTDNWQGLNSIKPLYKNQIDFIYIDPPFNTGSDFAYKDKYRDSTWLTLMENRVELSKELLKKKSNFFLHLDPKANYLGRVLLDKHFSKEYFKNEIIWYYRRWNIAGKKLAANHDTLFWYSNGKEYHYNQLYIPKSKKSSAQGKAWKSVIVDGIRKSIQTDEVTKGVPMPDMWEISMINPVSTERVGFSTQKPESLLKRVFDLAVEKNSIISDFFSGSGTTLSVAHKLKNKWIGADIGDHYYSILIPRLKKTLIGDTSGISEEVKWQGGGFFKYYELEQYEEVLAKAKFQWRGKEGGNQVEQYSFMQDEKLLDAIDIDYKSQNAKVVFEKLYPDVDIAETLSNLSGKHIKQIFEDKVVFEDDTEVIYNEMTFEKYPWIKPLIWWNSKK